MINTRLLISLITFLSITLSSVSFSQIIVVRQLAGSGGGGVNQTSNNLMVNHTISQTAIALDILSATPPPTFVAQGYWSPIPLFLSVDDQPQVRNKKMITNYPNPVNSFTTFSYNLEKAARVVLKVYDITGQEIATILDEYQTQGDKKIDWDVKGKDGVLVSSGTYLYELNVSNTGNNIINERNIMVIAR